MDMEALGGTVSESREEPKPEGKKPGGGRKLPAGGAPAPATEPASSQKKVLQWKKLALRELSEASSVTMLLGDTSMSGEIIADINEKLRVLKTFYNNTVKFQKQSEDDKVWLDIFVFPVAVQNMFCQTFCFGCQNIAASKNPGLGRLLGCTRSASQAFVRSPARQELPCGSGEGLRQETQTCQD